VLAKKPIIILVNEPTGNSDEQSGKGIIEMMVYL